jgi:hypothetical protein
MLETWLNTKPIKKQKPQKWEQSEALLVLQLSHLQVDSPLVLDLQVLLVGPQEQLVLVVLGFRLGWA